MEYTIEFGGEPQDLTVTLSGPADPAAFREYNDRIVSDPRFRAGLAILIDVSSLDTSHLTDDDLQVASAPMTQRDWDYPPLAIAVVAPDPQTYEDMTIARAHAGGRSSRRRVFTSREAALAWLSEEKRGRDRP